MTSIVLCRQEETIEVVSPILISWNKNKFYILNYLVVPMNEMSMANMRQ